MRAGIVTTVILDEAERSDADLIVIGSRDLGALRGVVLGSTARCWRSTPRCRSWSCASVASYRRACSSRSRLWPTYRRRVICLSACRSAA